jgi:hypothetical protein
VKDDAWAQGVLDRLKSDLWSAQRPGASGHLDQSRVDAILSKLQDELWSPAVDPKEREAWANHIIDKLRDELWTPVGNGPKRQPPPDEQKRVDAILARLKNELWSH